MKFTIKKNDIVDVLSRIQGLTGRKSSLAITECVLISANDGLIHLTATDLETGFEGSFPASVETPGNIAISARKFYEIIREFPNMEVSIHESGNRRITIGNEKVQYNLMTMNPDDYPPTAKPEVSEFFKVGESDFKRMIEKSLIISGVGEDKKPHINGVWFERLFDKTPALIRMVSTDGSRLSKYELDLEDQGKLTPGDSVLIPKKGLHEISKFLQSTGGEIQVGIQASYFVLKSVSETFYVRLLEGKFPEYAEILGRDDGFSIAIDKTPFLNMLKRMSILCNENYRAAIFTFEQGQLLIKATNPDIGDSKEDMVIEYGGDKIEAAFNPRFFIDALNGIDDDTLMINIVSEGKPCLIDGAEQKQYISAVMPMRV